MAIGKAGATTPLISLGILALSKRSCKESFGKTNENWPSVEEVQGAARGLSGRSPESSVFTFASCSGRKTRLLLTRAEDALMEIQPAAARAGYNQKRRLRASLCRSSLSETPD